MIKLIASDVDGTLLPEGTLDVNPEVFQVILKLKEKGILFAGASGRQFISMKSVFGPIQQDMIFIADNGAYVTCRGSVMACHELSRGLLEEIVAYIRQMENVCILLSTPTGAYTDSHDQDYINMLNTGYGIPSCQVEDVLKVEEPIVKASIYCTADDAANVAGPIIQHFAGRAHIMASGARWIDFMEEGVDKGHALETIQRLMKITPEETMAFGDNYNDMGMLSRAGESYAVANAREEVKAAAKHVMTTESKDGVLEVLKTLL